MRCPACGARNTRAIDVRPSSDAVRRRRCCASCDHRFTTYEVLHIGGMYGNRSSLEAATVTVRKRVTIDVDVPVSVADVVGALAREDAET